MLQGIEELKSKLVDVQNNHEIQDIIAPVPGLEIAISNARLLLDSLISFYKEEKSAYFPKSLTEQIENYISNASAQLNLLLSKKPDSGKPLQQTLDQLYVICLQSGIITFGFNSKDIIGVIEETKRDIHNLHGQIKALENELQKEKTNVQSTIQNWNQHVDIFIKDEQKKIADKSVNTTDSIDKEFQSFKTSLSLSMQKLNESLNTSNKLKDEIEAVHKLSNEQEINIKKQMELCQSTSTSIQETIKTSKKTIDTELKNIQTTVAQIQVQLNSVNQIASQITAKNSTADDIVAKIQERKKSADEFYKAVETYKQDMLESENIAKADYSELKESCDIKVAEYQAKTDEIVKQNISYQEQIKELLTKAVSGGLFKVFDQRQKFLSKGTTFWKWAVGTTSALVAISILIVAYICEAKPDIIFFVRLAIMIPLVFLMYFAATQYKKERMAEEEYAFKSAISLSLEPYRDLLVRMRKEDQLEADFVKKLMEEVFDNPVMRLFDIEEEEEKICKTIIGYLKKLPSDKASSVIETITEKIVKQ